MLPELRRSLGRTFCTVFPEDLVVPWKPLSIKDYLSFSEDINRGLYTLEQIEDEIFCYCVQDDSLIRQIGFLKAGIVHTVATHIWQVSGPNSAEGFNADLEAARHLLDPNSSHSLYHSLVNLITTAFPYIPEQVYDMDYKTLLIRAAMAESKLLNLGIIQQPINAYDPNTKPTKKKKVDLKKLYEQQQQEAPLPQSTAEDIDGIHHDKWWDKSPILEAAATHGIDFKTEALEADLFGLSGHEKQDKLILQHEMIKEARHIYKDVLARLDQQKKKDNL